MIRGLEIGFDPTTNIMWTYRVIHIEWVGNQPLGLKLVFKPKGSLCRFIHSFSHLRETAKVFSHLSLGFQEGSFVWIVVEGGAIPLRLSVRQGGFGAHTRLGNEDLPTQIRYSSTLESSDRINGSLVGLIKGRKFCFSVVYVHLIAIETLTDLSCNIELRQLYIMLHFFLNLSGIWKYSWKPCYLVLIIVSMNLFDQLVIVTCDPVMEG